MISENRSFLQQAAPHLLAWVEGLVNKPSIELINGKKSVVLNNSVMYEDIEGLFADNFKNFIESPDAFSSTFTPHNFDCLLYTSPSPRDMRRSRMPSSA